MILSDAAIANSVIPARPETHETFDRNALTYGLLAVIALLSWAVAVVAFGFPAIIIPALAGTFSMFAVLISLMLAKSA